MKGPVANNSSTSYIVEGPNDALELASRLRRMADAAYSDCQMIHGDLMDEAAKAIEYLVSTSAASASSEDAHEEEMLANAERYIWLTRHEINISIKCNGTYIRWTTETGKDALDNAIDNARANA